MSTPVPTPDPSGVRRHYGAEPTLPGSQPRRAQVRNEVGTFAWLLLLEEDPHGNYISYGYHHMEEQDRADLEKPQREPVLAEVAWGGNWSERLPHQFRAETTLGSQGNGPLRFPDGGTYLDSRVDQIVIGATAQASTDRRRVTPRLPSIGPRLRPFWIYDLGYQASGDTGRLLLRSVTRRAPGETDDQTTFSYSSSSTFAWGPAQELPGNLAGVYTQKSTSQQFYLDRSTLAVFTSVTVPQFVHAA